MPEQWQLFLQALPLEWMLFVSAFVSATLFPGGSEALLVASVLATPEPARWVMLTLFASVGNTLGAMTSWCIGRFLPPKEISSKALAWIDRYGAAMLLLSWVPLVGDALPLVAGWRRIDWRLSLLLIAIGKTARFVVVVWFALLAK